MRSILVLFLVLLCTYSASAEKRAFIVGVGEYQELTDLQKTIGDAEGYQRLFHGELRYKTTVLKNNPARRDFIAKFDTFVRSISPGDEVVFVFSGHGWSDGGDNYLSFADAPRGVSEAVLRAETIALEQMVMTELRKTRPNMILAIIDACRDEQYGKLTKSPGALDKGIVRVSAKEGELILYSAGAGQTSLDRLSDSDPSPYSVFTRVLLPLLSDAEMPLARIANETRRQVQELANTVQHNQRPEMMLGIDLDYCLSAQCKRPVEANTKQVGNSGSSVSEVERANFEGTMWEKAERQKNRLGYDAYLASFPSGLYAAEARRRLALCKWEHEFEWRPGLADFGDSVLKYGDAYGSSKSRACAAAKRNTEAKLEQFFNETRNDGMWRNLELGAISRSTCTDCDERQRGGWSCYYEIEQIVRAIEVRRSTGQVERCP